jgi:hypothetical protein
VPPAPVAQLLAPPLPAPVLRSAVSLLNGDLLQVPVLPYGAKLPVATSEIKVSAQESSHGISGI